MGQEQDKNKNKPKHELVVAKGSIGFSDSVSTIGGSIAQGYEALSSTFDVRQKNIADSFNLGKNVQYLKEIAQNLDKSLKLSEKQREEAIEDSKRQRKWSFISTAIAIVAIIVTIVVAFWHG